MDNIDNGNCDYDNSKNYNHEGVYCGKHSDDESGHDNNNHGDQNYNDNNHNDGDDHFIVYDKFLITTYKSYFNEHNIVIFLELILTSIVDSFFFLSYWTNNISWERIL